MRGALKPGDMSNEFDPLVLTFDVWVVFFFSTLGFGGGGDGGGLARPSSKVNRDERGSLSRRNLKSFWMALEEASSSRYSNGGSRLPTGAWGNGRLLLDSEMV